jgi:hypothetical protein
LFCKVAYPIKATTEEGQRFLDTYLPDCVVEAQCRVCGDIVVGDEVFRNRCICGVWCVEK